MLCPCAEGELHEQSRVAPPPVVIEIRRRSTHTDKLHVDVQPVADPKHVPEEATVLIDGVRPRLLVDADERARREETFRDGRRLLAEALGRVVDLRRVDLDETDARSI